MEAWQAWLGNGVVLVGVVVGWWSLGKRIDRKIDRFSECLSQQLSDLRDRVSRIEVQLAQLVRSRPLAPDAPSS